MSLIPVCLPNPGWRVIRGRQTEPGNAICNLGVEPKGVQHQSGFASLHFALISPMGSGRVLSCPPFPPHPGGLWSWPLPGCFGPVCRSAAPGRGRKPCFLGVCVNLCDGLLSCLPACLTPFFPKPSSLLFIFVADLLDTQLKCPFHSANCHPACFMNKFIHGQNPLNIFFFLRRWGRHGGEEEEIVPQVSEEAKSTRNPSRGLSYSSRM